MVTHLESNTLLDTRQSAYRRHHSWETAILYILNSAYLAMDNKKVTLLVLLDLSAAFDSVDHAILSRRLETCGIVNGAHDWIMSYLSNRKQFVSLCGVQSSAKDVQCGVPQGSVLGSLLFSVCLTGLRDVIASFDIDYIIYADDIQLFASASVSCLPNVICLMEECINAIKSC